MAKSKLSAATALVISAVAKGEVEDGELSLTLSTDDKGFKKQEEAYVAATEYRGNLVGAITTAVATEAQVHFSDEEYEDVEVVTGSMNFGPTELSATVFRNFVVDGEEAIPNHVVITSSDDYTGIVNDAVAGIFDEAEEAE